MNILEAFEKSNEAKIYENLSGITYRFRKSDPKGSIPFYLALLNEWEPVIEPLTFERIKRECVSMETLLKTEANNLVAFIGFNRCGVLITDTVEGSGAVMWKEGDIKNWQISSEKWEG